MKESTIEAMEKLFDRIATRLMALAMMITKSFTVIIMRVIIMTTKYLQPLGKHHYNGNI